MSGEPVQDPTKEAALRDGRESIEPRCESREVRCDWSVKFSHIDGVVIEGVSLTLDV